MNSSDDSDLLDQLRSEINYKNEHIEFMENSLREKEQYILDTNASMESRLANLEITEQLIPSLSGILIHLKGIVAHERNDPLLKKFREMKQISLS